MGTLLGNLSLEPRLGTLLGNLFLGTLLGNLWELCLGTLLGEPILGDLLGNLFLGTLLRNLFLGTLLNLAQCDLAAPTCSGTFTMPEDPKLALLGKHMLLMAYMTNVEIPWMGWKSCLATPSVKL